MKNLLLISNLSHDNVGLLAYAAKFCKYYETNLHVLHLSKDNYPVLISSPYNYKDFGIPYSFEQENKITQQVLNVTSGILEREFVRVVVKQGNQDSILKAFIVDNFIDMIVLGNRDLERKSDFLQHKNILLNILQTPLIVIPEFQIFEPLERFNFLTTHTKNDFEDIIYLATLFPKSHIKLTHLFSKKMDEFEIHKSDKWVKYVKHNAKVNVDYEAQQQELREYFQKENFAVIKKFDAFVFTSHKRNFWSRLLDPSTTLSFLSSLEIPSVIFKISNET